MPRAKGKLPTPGTALGVLALIVALAGTANAGRDRIIVRKGDIARGAVTTNALAKGAVKPRALAKGAVVPRALKSNAIKAAALAPGSVTARALAGGAVSAAALSPNAVSAASLAPGSVYGGALGPVAVHTAPIEDLDEAADLSTWTPSATATASCGVGERLLTGGVAINDPGNGRVAVLETIPFTTSGGGFVGRITSDSGGTAKAEVQAICLR